MKNGHFASASLLHFMLLFLFSINFQVVHKAFIEVNEEGAEAEAATAVQISLYSMPETFVAEHPFLFLIRDNRSKAVLFLGRINNPSG